MIVILSWLNDVIVVGNTESASPGNVLVDFKAILDTMTRVGEFDYLP
jgi:hypothetical protein